MSPACCSFQGPAERSSLGAAMEAVGHQQKLKTTPLRKGNESYLQRFVAHGLHIRQAMTCTCLYYLVRSCTMKWRGMENFYPQDSMYWECRLRDPPWTAPRLPTSRWRVPCRHKKTGVPDTVEEILHQLIGGLSHYLEGLHKCPHHKIEIKSINVPFFG